MRKIIHIDMDSFYASVEQRDNPKLRNRPIVVGSDSLRGVVSTASYEARKYGIHSAMPSVMAKKLCKHLIFVPVNMEKYKSVSQQIRNIFYDYTDLVEPLSFDEAYLDVTTNKKNNPSATLIAKEIKARIKKELNLTASAGVSYNKFLAKMASDVNKPNGIFVITPDNAQSFLNNLSINKFFGIGKKTTAKMHKIGVFVGSDLRRLSLNKLTNEFGKVGRFYYNCVRGIDEREVNPQRKRKSVGAESTFANNLTQKNEITDSLLLIAKKLFTRVENTKLYGRTITLKIKQHDLSIHTKSQTFAMPIFTFDNLWDKALLLLDEVFKQGLNVRLLGLTISNFLTEEQEAVQLEFDWGI